MFHDYIRSIMPCPVENIEQSDNNSYFYRITLLESLLNEYKASIDKRLGKNKKIKSYEGWFYFRHPNGLKYALVEFKRKNETRGN